MGLAYSSSAYGLTDDPFTIKLIDRVRFSDNAWAMHLREDVILNTHIRGGKSVNRRQFLPGTNTRWIPPSNYSRSQYIITYKSAAKYRSSDKTLYYSGNLGYNMLKLAFQLERSRAPGWLGGVGVTPPITSNWVLANAKNKATTKALNDLGGAKAQLGEALATSRKTADLFVDSVKALLKVYVGVRRGDLRKVLDGIDDLSPAQFKRLVNAGKIPGNVANKWLAFHYGWKPLAQDVYGTWEILKESLAGTPAMLVHGRGAATETASGLVTCPWSIGQPICDVSYDAEWKVRVNLTGRVQEAGIMRAVNQAGLVNPAALAWELVPFSFVVDWFVPVGGVLNALSATSGLTFVGGHRTERWNERYEGTPSGASQLSREIAITQNHKAGFDRIRYSGFPGPAPYIKPFYTGGDRWATIAALLTGFAKNWK